MKKSIGLLVSNYMFSYIRDLSELCYNNSIEIDLFCFEEYKPNFEYKMRYLLKSKYNPKKILTVRNIENEIKQLVEVNKYDYILSDCIGLSFKNSCNIFHNYTLSYKIEHMTNNIIRLVSKMGHYNRLKIESEYYKNSKLCIVGSKEVKKDFNKICKIPLDRIKIIYPGINVENVELKKDDNRPFTIGQVTCGFNTKGGYRTLAAIRKLKKSLSSNEIHFKFINPNYEKEWYLKLYVKIFGLNKYIEFLPYYKNINNFYKNLDCLICASRMEAFGRVVPEAMIRNIPVIVASNVGACDIIENGINGYIYNSSKNGTNNLCEIIKKVIMDKDINIELIDRARIIANQITWKNFSNKLFITMFPEYSL